MVTLPSTALPPTSNWHDPVGIAQNLFPIFLEEDVRNIRVRKIIHPAPHLERSWEPIFFCPHFSDSAFFLRIPALGPRPEVGESRFDSPSAWDDAREIHQITGTFAGVSPANCGSVLI
jgi:hypothetical protein